MTGRLLLPSQAYASYGHTHSTGNERRAEGAMDTRKRLVHGNKKQVKIKSNIEDTAVTEIGGVILK